MVCPSCLPSFVLWMFNFEMWNKENKNFLLFICSKLMIYSFGMKIVPLKMNFIFIVSDVFKRDNPLDF